MTLLNEWKAKVFRQLFRMCWYWERGYTRRDSELLEKAFKDATHDHKWPQALANLGIIFRGTGDKKVLKLLANIVLADLLAKAFKDATDDGMWPDALAKIASSYRGTGDKKVSRVLAGIVLDESHSSDMRLVAYLVLFEVCNLPLQTLPHVHEFKLPENFDMSFLQKCLM